MLKLFLNNIFHQKFYLMFITTVIYIFGLLAFFQERPLLISGLLFFLFILLLFKKYISSRLVFFWILIFFIAFFNAFFRIKDGDALCSLAGNNAIVRGQVVTIPDNGMPNKIRFFFDVDEITFNGQTKNISSKTYVTLVGNDNVTVGDYYELDGKLRSPFRVSNPSQFDYSKYLRNFNTYTVFYADSEKRIDKKISFKWLFLQKLNNIRREILSYHSEHISSPNIEILGGIVFGDDAVAPPDNIKKSFINAGILHILAASGMNVALIYGIFFFILQKMKIPYRLNNVVGIFIVILYTLMTGMGPSVIRASVILIFILIGKLFDRDAHSLSLLSFVAFLMLLFNPAYINDVGFQLSFIVTFGLLIMTKPLLELFEKLPKFLSSAVFVPIIAQLWVAPVQMFYFNTFCLYSVFVNILILPLITIISFGGFISSVLAMIKPIAPFICLTFDFYLNPVLTCLVKISDYFAGLPNSIITTPKPNFIQIVIYYIILILFTEIIRKRINKKIVLIFCLSILFLGCTFIKIPTGSEIIFFDVQNADCMLYKTQKNKYFIIDTGKLGYNGGKSQVNYTLLEYLKDEGVREIEGLILTHFDADHSGGAEDLLKNIKINNVYINSFNDKSNIAKRIYNMKPNLTKVKNNKIIYEEPNIKIKTYIGNFYDKKYENENSIITLIDENGYNMLLMGDAGIIGFNKIEKYLPDKIDVLKVGHHGAKDVVDKKMVERISPHYSIISTGINRYGHPNKATIDILSPTVILRTDRNNAIKIKNRTAYFYDSNKGWVKFAK